MQLLGTIRNGLVELDTPPNLPEGTRVLVLLETDEIEDFDDLPVPPYQAETYEQHLAILRKSIEDSRTGKDPGIPLDEAMDQISADLGLPLITPERQRAT